MAEQRILVTGSAGFIGSHVCLELLKRGFDVVGVDNFNDYYHPAVKEARSRRLLACKGFVERRVSIENYAALESVFNEYRFDVVCHLAAQAGVRYSISNPFAYEKSNLSGFLSVAELVRRKEIRRLVYASSSSVYAGNTKIPFAESDPVDTPISLYAATKKANELIAHCYSHLYGFQSVGLRFFTVYGPWGRPDMALWLFTEAMLNGEKIKIFNHGNMKRDFTYVDDIVKGVVGAMFAKGLDQYEIFNLGNCRCEPLLKLISLAERELGVQAEKEFLPMQPGDVPETYADIDKARHKLGFEPSTPIEEGVPAFIAWYKDNSELVKLVRDSRGKRT